MNRFVKYKFLFTFYLYYNVQQREKDNFLSFSVFSFFPFIKCAYVFHEPKIGLAVVQILIHTTFYFLILNNCFFLIILNHPNPRKWRLIYSLNLLKYAYCYIVAFWWLFTWNNHVQNTTSEVPKLADYNCVT